MTPGFIPVVHGAALDRPDERDTVATAEAVRQVLVRLGWRSEVVAVGPDLRVLDRVVARRPALVFNLVEALGGDGAQFDRVPARLERSGVRFTGCRAAACRDCLDKTETKRRMRNAGLPTPDWSMAGDGFDGGARVIVKSATEHASIGIDSGSVVPAGAAAAEIAARAARHGGRFFAERYVDGREFNLSLLEGPDGLEVLPPAEILFVDFPPDRPRIVDYEAKWLEGAFAYVSTPRRFEFPDRDRRLLRRLEELARAVWGLFRLNGYARVDFRVDGAGRPWILEVNTNPCLAPDAGFFAAAERAGLDYDAMIARVVSAAAGTRARAA